MLHVHLCQTAGFALDLCECSNEEGLKGAIVRQHFGGGLWSEGIVTDFPGTTGMPGTKSFQPRSANRSIGLWGVQFDAEDDDLEGEREDDDAYGEREDVMGALELLACLVDPNARCALYACQEYVQCMLTR